MSQSAAKLSCNKYYDSSVLEIESSTTIESIT